MPACREREVLIIRGSENKAQKRRTAAEIVLAVKSSSDSAKEIVKARRLSSGIIAFIFKSIIIKNN
jgi:hypothetical protein